MGDKTSHCCCGCYAKTFALADFGEADQDGWQELPSRLPYRFGLATFVDYEVNTAVTSPTTAATFRIEFARESDAWDKPNLTMQCVRGLNSAGAGFFGDDESIYVESFEATEDPEAPLAIEPYDAKHWVRSVFRPIADFSESFAQIWFLRYESGVHLDNVTRDIVRHVANSIDDRGYYPEVTTLSGYIQNRATETRWKIRIKLGDPADRDTITDLRIVVSGLQSIDQTRKLNCPYRVNCAIHGPLHAESKWKASAISTPTGSSPNTTGIWLAPAFGPQAYSGARSKINGSIARPGLTITHDHCQTSFNLVDDEYELNRYPDTGPLASRSAHSNGTVLQFGSASSWYPPGTSIPAPSGTQFQQSDYLPMAGRFGRLNGQITVIGQNADYTTVRCELSCDYFGMAAEYQSVVHSGYAYNPQHHGYFVFAAHYWVAHNVPTGASDATLPRSHVIYHAVPSSGPNRVSVLGRWTNSAGSTFVPGDRYLGAPFSPGISHTTVQSGLFSSQFLDSDATKWWATGQYDPAFVYNPSLHADWPRAWNYVRTVSPSQLRYFTPDLSYLDYRGQGFGPYPRLFGAQAACGDDFAFPNLHQTYQHDPNWPVGVGFGEPTPSHSRPGFAELRLRWTKQISNWSVTPTVQFGASDSAEYFGSDRQWHAISDTAWIKHLWFGVRYMDESHGVTVLSQASTPGPYSYTTGGHRRVSYQGQPFALQNFGVTWSPHANPPGGHAS